MKAGRRELYFAFICGAIYCALAIMHESKAFGYTGCPGETSIVAEYIFHNGSYNNMVASEALLLTGAGHVSNFSLLQAAVTAHCYDPRDVLSDSYFDRPEPAPDLYRHRFEGINTSLGGNKAVNFYNPSDYALGKWSIYEKYFKPDWTFGYSYDLNTGQSMISYEVVDPLTGLATQVILRYVDDPYELLAFVARPRAVSTGMQGNTQGSVTIMAADASRLDTTHGFGVARPDHSGQFTRDIFRLRPFYRALLKSFDIIP